jgi:hypothetical protein
MPDKFVWFEFGDISEEEIKELEKEAKKIARENGREDSTDSDWLRALGKFDRIEREKIENGNNLGRL